MRFPPAVDAAFAYISNDCSAGCALGQRDPAPRGAQPTDLETGRVAAGGGGSSGASSGGERAAAVGAGSHELVTWLACDLYQRLSEYVETRVNRSLGRCAALADASAGRYRTIGILEAPEMLAAVEGNPAAGAREGSAGNEEAGRQEAGFGLADLMSAVVNDVIVHRMRALGADLKAECIEQGVPCASSDSCEPAADDDHHHHRHLIVSKLVESDGLLPLLQRVLVLPKAAAGSVSERAAQGTQCGAAVCDSSEARRVVRFLQRLSGYVSAKRVGEKPGASASLAPPGSRGGRLAVPDIVVEHSSGTRTYCVEQLLRDAASTRGGFLRPWRELVALLRCIQASSSSGDAPPAHGEPAERTHASWRVSPSPPLCARAVPSAGGGGIFFIQCLASNSGGSEHFFDSPLVQTQLRGCRLVEAARVGRRVLPALVRMRTFCQRYLGLLQGAGMIPPDHALHAALACPATPESERVQAILLHVSATDGHVRIGRSKVFLHDDLLASLEQKRLVLPIEARDAQPAERAIYAQSALGKGPHVGARAGRDAASGREGLGAVVPCGTVPAVETRPLAAAASTRQTAPDAAAVAPPAAAAAASGACEELVDQGEAGLEHADGDSPEGGVGGVEVGAGVTAEHVRAVEEQVATLELQMAALSRVSTEVLRSVEGWREEQHISARQVIASCC